MALYHFLVLLMSCVPAFSGRISGRTGVTCCIPILKQQLAQEKYAYIKSYTLLPGQGRCPQYLIFTMVDNSTVCLLPSKAQEMKKAVDARSAGAPQDTPSMDFQSGSKQGTGKGKGTAHPTSSPGESTPSPGPVMPTLTTTALPGQDGGTSLPSVPVSPPSTDAQGHGTPQTSSSAAQPLPGRQREDTMSPTLPPSTALTHAQTYGGSQTAGTSAPARTGLDGQERPSTIQTTAAPSSTAQLPHEDDTTKSWAETTLRTSHHPVNIIASTMTPPLNEQEMEETRTVGVIDSPSSTTARKRGPEVSGRSEWTSGGSRWHVGLFLALIVTAATAFVWVTSVWREYWLVPPRKPVFRQNRTSGTVTLLCYSNLQGGGTPRQEC
ncbi:uncharacterized protein [Scyliorhinus torazame]|uniref:uncharacterized protein n=1 Tax=Scyliorhinus torazame TaxID=75743 RepID=UPI003B593AB9